jgi:hypothetical protein
VRTLAPHPLLGFENRKKLGHDTKPRVPVVIVDLDHDGFESGAIRQNKTFEPAQRASKAPRAPQYARLHCFW